MLKIFIIFSSFSHMNLILSKQMYKEKKAHPSLTFTALLRVISATGLAFTSAPRDPFLLSLVLKMAAGVSKMGENL